MRAQFRLAGIGPRAACLLLGPQSGIPDIRLVKRPTLLPRQTYQLSTMLMRRGAYRNVLARSSADQFATLVEELLSAILPDIAQSRRLRELDKEGIDVFQFDALDHSIKLAVQCKGYEREWRSDRVGKLIAEIEKFVSKSSPVEEYWLVLNRSIVDPADRSRIEAELKKCEQVGMAAKARLLDLDKFLKHIKGSVLRRFKQLAEARRTQYSDDYLSRMGSTAYIEEVPFRDGNVMQTNLTGAVVGKIAAYAEVADPSHTGKYRKTPKFLVTGSFGFGKTAGMHHLGTLWAQRNEDVYFIPAAALGDEAYVNSAGLLDHIVDQVSDERLISSDLARDMLRDICKAEFRTRYPLLLIDAIDESNFWQYPERLSALWRSIAELGNPAVITVRDELYQSRPSDFIFGSDDDAFRHLSLCDWDSDLMKGFADAFAEQRGGEVPRSFLEFRETIAEGRYEATYGDIPRRPLFLRMLAEDAWAGNRPEKDLHRVYGRYFRQKLARDWESASAPGSMVRSTHVTHRFGKEQAVEEMLWLMQATAKLIAREVAAGLRSESWIGEAELRDLVEQSIGHLPVIEEILLISMLQPAARDPVTRRRSYKFAHQSFLDWFTARALVESQPNDFALEQNFAVRGFFDAMQLDLEQGNALP